MDNLVFKSNHTIFSFMTFLTIYIFGAFPENFYILHTMKTILYFIIRFYTWKKKKSHYYMLEFCYFFNVFASIVNIYFANDVILQKIIFTCANGPIATSVIALNNKLIFHSNDYIISSFIHTSPMLLSYVNKWIISPYDENLNLTNYFEHIYYSILLYVGWFVPYYIILYVVLYKRTIEKKNITMFDYSIENSMNFIKKISNNRRTQQLIYSFFHFMLYLIGISISPILWYSKTLHFFYIMIVTLSMLWNSGSYYYYVIENNNKK